MTQPRYLHTGLVLVYRDLKPPQWCALRASYVGDRLVTTCLAELAYGPVHVVVVRPGERLPHNTCPQCKRHVTIAMTGACVPVEAPVVVRTDTRDLRKRTPMGTRWAVEDAATSEEWDDGAPQSAVPEVVLNDMTSRRVMTR